MEPPEKKFITHAQVMKYLVKKARAYWPGQKTHSDIHTRPRLVFHFFVDILCFLKGPARWLTEHKNSKYFRAARLRISLFLQI